MKQNFEQRYGPVETSCEYCGKPIVTSAWNVPEFCHDDCTNGWLSDRSVWSCRVVGGVRRG